MAPIAALISLALTILPVLPNRAKIERSVAGYTIEKSTAVAIRDSRSGYYLVRAGD